MLLSLTVALVLGDLLVFWWENRATGGRPAGQIPWTRLNDPPINDQTPGGLRLRRFLDTKIMDPISGRTVSFRTNQFGYRGGLVAPKAPGEFRILCLGDSITLSSYTEENESYPYYLAELLAPAVGRLSVLNAGMRGAGLREELLIFTETGIFTQCDVVFLGMFLNDAKGSRTLPIPEGLLAYSAIARQLRNINLQSEIEEEARARYEKYAGKPYPTGDFGKEAWRTDRAAFEAQIAAAAADWGFAWFSAAWDEMRPDLVILKELCDRHGLRLVVGLFPATIQVEADFLDDRPQQMFEGLMKELNVPHLDLLPVLREAYRKAGHPLAYDHCHLTPEGNKVAAVEIAKLIKPHVPASSSP